MSGGYPANTMNMKRETTTKFFCALSAVLLLGTLGCSSDSAVDIGDGKTGERLSDYADVWEGYAEAHTFADGSDKVEIVLDHDGAGTITFGDSAAPAVDPPDATHDGYPRLVLGFGYAVRFATVENQRLRFSFDINEPATPWCELQTPYFSPQNKRWACAPDGQSRLENNGQDCWLRPDGAEGEMPIDCSALWICMAARACACTSEECSTPTYSEQRRPLFAVDGTMSDAGNSLEGTLELNELDTQRPVLRLTRR